MQVPSYRRATGARVGVWGGSRAPVAGRGGAGRGGGEACNVVLVWHVFIPLVFTRQLEMYLVL